MPNTITFLKTLFGSKVGDDPFGNTYYQQRKAPKTGRRRRWVIYGPGGDEASRVPPLYHGWLHYVTDTFPSPEDLKRHAWNQPHVPNLTGTDKAWTPPGDVRGKGQRDKATGDYESWVPDNQ